jgi:hypothetical protein
MSGSRRLFGHPLATESNQIGDWGKLLCLQNWMKLAASSGRN